MIVKNNPQHEQMADESMLRTLKAQADAIWPQEKLLIEQYGLPAHAQVLDFGCGPGEISRRLLEWLPSARLVGLDADSAHLQRAEARCLPYDGRAHFVRGDVVDLDPSLFEQRFDLCLCRHVLQAVPHTEKVLENLVGLCKPGGRVHVVAEDYGMMFFHPVKLDIDAFWRDGPVNYGLSTGTDILNGRKVFGILYDLGLKNLRVEYVSVDTLKVPRQTFADILIAWRDGYSEAIAEHSPLNEDYVRACFDDMIQCVLNPAGYAIWQLPVVSGTLG